MDQYSFTNGKGETIRFSLVDDKKAIRETVVGVDGIILVDKIHNPTMLANFLSRRIESNPRHLNDAIAFIVQECGLSRFFVKFSDGEIVCIYAFVGANQFTLMNEARKMRRDGQIISITEE